MALAATAGRLPAHTFAEAVKAAYDCCAAPLKVLRAGTMGRVSDTGRLTHAQPRSSHIPLLLPLQAAPRRRTLPS